MTLHGFTPGCAGCEAAQAGRVARRHSDECRARIEKAVEEASDSFRDEAQAKERLVAARAKLKETAEESKAQTPEEVTSHGPQGRPVTHEG